MFNNQIVFKLREAAKKNIFLTAGPLRPYPPPLKRILTIFFLPQRICLALIPVTIFFTESFLMLPMGVYREY